MIELYGMGQQFGVIDASPFVSKIHAFLRFANIEYQTINDIKNFSKAPKAKLPFIVDQGQVISDSQFIIEYLIKKYDVKLNDHLSETDQAQAYLLGKSLDENLYWCLYWSRWQHENTWKKVKAAYFQDLPFPIKVIVPAVLRKKAIKAIKAQGMGRHSEQEIHHIADCTFKSLSNILADKTYFFGEKVSVFDATAYAFLEGFIQSNIDNEMNRTAQAYSNLKHYTDRIKLRYFNS